MAAQKIDNEAKKGPRENNELFERLIDQLDFIDTSAKSFDEGREKEAVRLAMTLRVLLHDGSSPTATPSLLKLLDIKDKLKFVGTAIERDRFTAAQTEFYGRCPISASPTDVGFLELRPSPDGTYGYVAPLTEHRFPPDSPQAKATPTNLAFEDWWTAPVIETLGRTYFSRHDLVNIMANQEGGAHVSEKLNKDYSAFKREGLGVGMIHSDGNSPLLSLEEMVKQNLVPPVRNDPAAASARQIAFELATTLHRYIDALPDDHILKNMRKPMYKFQHSPRINVPFFSGPTIFASANPPQSLQAEEKQPFDWIGNARAQLADMYSFSKNTKKPTNTDIQKKK